MSLLPAAAASGGHNKPNKRSAAASASADTKRPRLTSPTTSHGALSHSSSSSLLLSLRRAYHDCVAEQHYLQAGNSLLDYLLWRQSCPRSLLAVLKANSLDEDDRRWISELEKSGRLDDLFPRPPTVPPSPTTGGRLPPVVNCLQLPPPAPQQQPPPSTAAAAASDADAAASGTSGVDHHQQQRVRHQPTEAPFAQSQDAAAAKDQAEIADQAKHEAQVMQKVAELKAAGLWSSKRLPKCVEPARPKSHWDYLLEEMQWLAADFMQERKFRRVFSRKMCLMVQRHFREKEELEKRQEKEEFHNLKRIASQCARMVREWWIGIQKVVEFKHSNRLEEKRRKALDLHLNFIVDQTEKYSEWLVEGLSAGGPSSSAGADSDQEFVPRASDLDADLDDEETIARAEAEEEQVEAEKAEIANLQRDMEQPMEELLRSLPPEILARPASLAGSGSGSDAEEADDDDAEFCANSDDSDAADIEDTIAAEEAAAGATAAGHDDEVDQLAAEAELPIEELLKRYQGAFQDDADATAASAPAADAATAGDDHADAAAGGGAAAAAASCDTSDQDDSAGGDVSRRDKSASENIERTDDDDIAEAKSPTPKDDATAAAAAASAAPAGSSSKLDSDYQELAAEALSALPRGFTLKSAQVSVPIPHLLRGGSLREYQVVGLDWLAALYEKRLNGILADEMGLGKTIQTIALLAHLACDRGVWGPHLIVVPTSVMLNWEMEFKKWCPGFKILTYFGSLRERKEKRKGWTKTNAFHVCITSYKLAIQDSRCFKLKKWKYLILDEAQNIKNFKSQRWQTLLTFNSQRRLLLTGTPLQNSLMELWSLMHFLMPQVFQSHREFREWFANPLTGMVEGTQEYSDQLVRRLHKVLRPFLLRRLKKDVEKQMPKKYEHIVMCRLSKRQRFLYDDFMSQAATKETLATGHFMSVINVLMQLRKVCNHPNLFEERPTVSPLRVEPLRIDAPGDVVRLRDYDPLSQFLLDSLWPNLCDMERDLPSFVADRADQLRPKRPLIVELSEADRDPVAAAETVFDFPGLPVSRKPFISRGTLKESKLELAKSSALPPGARTPPEKVDIRQLCKKLAGDRSSAPAVDPDELLPDAIRLQRKQARLERLGLLDRLSRRRCQHRPVYGCDLLAAVSIFRHPTLAQSSQQSGVGGSWRRGCPWTGASQRTQPRAQFYWLSRGHLHCQKAQLRRADPRLLYASTGALEALVRRPEDLVDSLADVIDKFCFAVPPVLAGQPVLSCPWQQQRKQDAAIEAALAGLSRRAALLHPIASRQAVQFPDGRLIQYDCGKLQSLDLLLRRLKPKGHRVLIFTQMARMLDILEQFLSYHGHIYVRLDGTTRVEQRQILMERFNADSRIFVFILSTRSGGLGVNLTGADTVVFYDSDWNPTMDAQAQDRCHRIGQTRDVHIYRLISERTVEENILKKANQKRWLNDVAIEGGNFTAAFLQQNTIRELFSEPSGLEELVAAKKKTARVAAEPQQQQSRAADSENPVVIEKALEEVEDESDRRAAEKAKKETVEELAEFDEDIPWDENEALLRQREQRLERQLAALESELSSLERYGLSFIESHQELAMNWELEQAEVSIEQSKREWELQQLKQLRQEEELRAEIEEDDMFYCYGAYDPASQVRELRRRVEAEAMEAYGGAPEEDEAAAAASGEAGTAAAGARTADRLVSSLGIRQVQLADSGAAPSTSAGVNEARRRSKKRQQRRAAAAAAESAEASSSQQQHIEESLVLVDDDTEMSISAASMSTVQLPTLMSARPQQHQQKRKSDLTERSFRLFPPPPPPQQQQLPFATAAAAGAPSSFQASSNTGSVGAGVTLVPPQQRQQQGGSGRPVTLVTRQIVIPNGQVIHQQFIQPRFLQQQQQQQQSHSIRLVQLPQPAHNLVLLPTAAKQSQPHQRQQHQLITLQRAPPSSQQQQTVRLVPAPPAAVASPGSAQQQQHQPR